MLALEPKRRSRITPEDVLAIAKMVANRLTETEACNQLDIKPESWQQWKIRHKNTQGYERVFTRIKGAKILACMDGIERAGPKDWRAYDRLLQITDARFRQSSEGQGVASTTVNILADTSLVDAIKRVYLESGKGHLAGLPAPASETSAALSMPSSKSLPANTIDVEASPMPTCSCVDGDSI